MNRLITSAASMSSLEIAELVGSRHDKVKQSIERLVERSVIVQPPMGGEQNIDAMGRSRVTQVYVFSGEKGKRDSIVVVAQLSPEFTARLVDRWQELEQGVEAKLPSNYIEALEAHLQSEREKLVIAHERDEAIRTKAQIGSRREATAMATASAAKREAQMLLHELGRNQHHATVRAVERATGEKFARNAYVELRRWCKKHNVAAQDVPDERHGSVKAWPAGAWLEAFDISLSALFGIDRSGGGNTGSLSHG